MDETMKELVSRLWLHCNSINSIAGELRYHDDIDQTICRVLYGIQKDLQNLLQIVDDSE